VHLAAAQHTEGVRGAGLLHKQGNILQQFPNSLALRCCSSRLALAAGEGAVVDAKRHLDGGLGDLGEGQRLLDSAVADRIANRHALYAEIQTMSPTCARSTGVRFSPSNWYMFVIFACRAPYPYDRCKRTPPAHGDLAALDAAYRDAPHVVVVVDAGHQQLQRLAFRPFRRAMKLSIVSSSGLRFSPGSFGEYEAVPLRAEQ